MSVAPLQDLVIIGTGGFAREVYWLLQEINAVSPLFRVLGFVGPEDPGNLPAPWLGNDSEVRRHFQNPTHRPKAIAAIGDGRTRGMLMIDYMEEGWEFPILQHPTALVGTHTEIMPGTILCAGSILTVNISAGMGLIVNLHTTVGHDCELGAFVTLSPGCHLSGNAQLGDYVQMGTGSVVLPGISIGQNTEIGAGAVVNRTLPSHVVAVGVPARVIRNR